jgi:hypothetical protein
MRHPEDYSEIVTSLFDLIYSERIYTDFVWDSYDNFSTW